MTGARAAVLGKPVSHSLSPVLHRAAYDALGLSGWTYERVECDEPGLAPFVAGLGPEWVGLSLTMPLKRAALDVATERSAAVEAIGAANTLLLAGGRVRADNTDALGIVDALRAAGVSAPRRPVLLGAGGTAQAVVAALAALGTGPVIALVREPSRAASLAETARRLDVGLRVRPFDAAAALPARADLVVSTLPGAAADRFAAADWGSGVVLFDVVYDPWPTPLAAAATAAGARVLSGLDLLVHQAAHQVRLMTGRDVPVDVLRAALAAVR